MMPKNTQIVLFSATYSDEVRDFATRFAPDANQFKLKVEELSVSTIKQFYMDCKNSDHKFEVLDALYALLTIGQSIIFVQVMHISAVTLSAICLNSIRQYAYCYILFPCAFSDVIRPIQLRDG